MSLSSVISETLRGKDVYRILMNDECRHETIAGLTLDIGSGTTLASYHRFLKSAIATKVECLDLGFEDSASGARLDLETDELPKPDNTIDTALLFNVLEHVYATDHLLAQIKRVLKPSGKLIGVVPFLVSYHPDPHDFWRFSRESLEKVLERNGFKEIKIKSLGLGPFTAAWSQQEVVIPRLLKLICLPVVIGLDKLIIKYRPKLNQNKFALGYFFSARK